MSTIAVQEDIRIPTWVIDLESFRRWAQSDRFPERGRFSHLAGGLWVDLSMESLGHNQAKGEISVVLGALVKAGKLGRIFFDRMRLTNAEAELSTEPDAMFASEVKLPGARLRFEHVIEPRRPGSRITHRVTRHGPLALLYTPFVKRGIERGPPDGVDRLATIAADRG